ncbi:hypothetical protein V6Z11_D06G059900 [Gossypium hirsutum]
MDIIIFLFACCTSSIIFFSKQKVCLRLAHYHATYFQMRTTFQLMTRGVLFFYLSYFYFITIKARKMIYQDDKTHKLTTTKMKISTIIKELIELISHQYKPNFARAQANKKTKITSPIYPIKIQTTKPNRPNTQTKPKT